VVRVFGNSLRLGLHRAPEDPIQGLKAVFSIRSSKDHQAVTFRIDEEAVHLSPGVAPDAAIVITMDFDRPEDKPRISNLWRHPLLAWRIGKLLSLPLPNWADSAKRFWSASRDLPHMPARLIITCSDEQRSLSFGEGEPRVELIATAKVLEQLLVGNTLLVQELISGKVRIRGKLQHMAGLTQACQKLMLGEIHG
ncbi:MAG: hypothetical protein O3B72_10800, partial [Proteobacteria bacterium]|nr:hypothetical protein [Pseudomonadota bacterium]